MNSYGQASYYPGEAKPGSCPVSYATSNNLCFCTAWQRREWDIVLYFISVEKPIYEPFGIDL